MFQAEGTVYANSWRNERKQHVHRGGGNGKVLYFWGQGKVNIWCKCGGRGKGWEIWTLRGPFPLYDLIFASSSHVKWNKQELLYYPLFNWENRLRVFKLLPKGTEWVGDWAQNPSLRRFSSHKSFKVASCSTKDYHYTVLWWLWRESGLDSGFWILWATYFQFLWSWFWG